MEERVEPEALASALKALAHEKRVRMARFLVEPHSLEEIASELNVARQTAHEHLQQLLEVGLVTRVEGRDRPGMAFVLVRPRLFQLYETFGRLGELEVKAPDAGLRHVTQPDARSMGPMTDEDLPRIGIVHGMRIGSVATLAGAGPWLLGRDPHATVCLDYDPYASERHAEIRRGAQGFEIADLYSSNGTAVDQKPVARGGVMPLPNGAIVRVGRTLLSFRHPAAKSR